MSRMLKAYRTRFHQKLRQTGARRLDQGVEWLVNKARRISVEEGVPLATALETVSEALAARPSSLAAPPGGRTPADIHFFCDAGLGGLARWLRAAGYRAEWQYGIADESLLSKAQATRATLLTTDSMLMERRVVRDEIVPALWLPPTLSLAQQLEKVVGEFGLRLSAPRCMSCGGELARADKERWRDQIPPKTYRWLNEYFLCTECGKLFWHGTHWSRIVQRLRGAENRCGNREPGQGS